ncbi:MAG: ATP-grasp domain-containing protein [Proteobacteria bacterium]|nr:ATP-grasp domain-containing protein [Pseudomonadota bacterium]
MSVGIGLKGKRVLLLVPPVTYRATDFVLAANRLELDVVIGSDGALPLGGNPVVRVDPADLGASARRVLATVGAVDAVVAVDADMLPLAARIGAALGLAGNTPESVAAASDKAIQRRLWNAAGVAQPRFQIVPADAAESRFREAARSIGFPCVVKPVSLSASRGVMRADDEAGLSAAASEIRAILAESGGAQRQAILLEEYVPGWELSIDGLLADGTLAVTAIFDKPDTPDGPTFEETLLVTPSRLPAAMLAAATGLAEQAARALGLTRGPIHAELRIDRRSGDARPVMLELAARSIGGLCSRSLRFLGGTSLEMLILLNALGIAVDLGRPPGASGVLMLPVERGGVLQAIEGQAEARAVAGITGLSITIPLGQPVRPLPWGDRYLGFIFAEGGDADEVEAALRRARDRLRPVIVQRESPTRPGRGSA